jgi:hypothetical protein
VPSGVLDRYQRRIVARERGRRKAGNAVLAAIDLIRWTFARQRQFIEDACDQVVALCSRRAGKSSAARVLLVKTAVENPGTVSVLVTQTRVAAKKLYWKQLQKVLRDLDVPFETNTTELVIRLPNGSEIWLAGAKDSTEIERLRGYAFKLVVIDEAQAIRDDIIRPLVEDVLQWALVDHRGRLVVIGTPPLVPVGWFVERYQGVDAEGKPVLGWARHHWTIFDNERMPGGQVAVAAYLEKLRRDRGISEGSPTWRREVLGELVLDVSQLVLSAFDLEASVYTLDVLPQERPTVILGIDIGYLDADAIIALARFPSSNDLWVIEEWEESHQTEEQLGAHIKDFNERHRPIKKIADTGGGGRKTVEGISKRLGLDIEAAHKPSVVEQFMRLNDEFRARSADGKSRLRVLKGGRVQHDAIRMAWAPGKIGQQIAKTPHSNVLPALSYAYSGASRYFTPPPEDPTPKITPQEQRERERLARYAQNEGKAAA